MPSAPGEPAANPRAAFSHPNFRRYLAARLAVMLGWNMQAIAVAQQVYSIHRSPMDLGLIGLMIFVPSILFSLPAGQLADTFDRRRIILGCLAVQIACTAGFLLLTHFGVREVWWYFAILLAVGTARAISGPAMQAFLPQVVPAKDFPNAVMWNSSAWQFSSIAGPGIGGLLYGLFERMAETRGESAIFAFLSARVSAADAASFSGAQLVYLLTAMLFVTGWCRLLFVRGAEVALEKKGASAETILAGIRFIRERPIILGALTLDLFAVLLGGAAALLPVYANDILHIGSAGLGLLKAMPAVGALTVALALAHLPPLKNAGKMMMGGVACFGLATIAFGLSRNVYLSVACLFVLGAADMVSVVVRHTLIQMNTPHEMRGRVSAVNGIFITASNELGDFESGVTAAWWGPVAAVVVGGAGTVLIAAVWARLFPSLLAYGTLGEAEEKEALIEEPAETGPTDVADSPQK